MICPGTLNCKEVYAIGEQHFHDEVEFNIAVWAHYDKCPALLEKLEGQSREVLR